MWCGWGECVGELSGWVVLDPRTAWVGRGELFTLGGGHREEGEEAGDLHRVIRGLCVFDGVGGWVWVDGWARIKGESMKQGGKKEKKICVGDVASECFVWVQAKGKRCGVH